MTSLQATFEKTLWGNIAALAAVISVTGLAFLLLRSWLDAAPPLIMVPVQSAEEVATGPVGLANPASVYCIDHGGMIDIMMGWDSGQVGVCTFPSGFKCEEWAMMRGECPIGGVAILHTWDTSELYCAIRGGEVWRINSGLEPSLCAFTVNNCTTEEYYKTGTCLRK